MSTSRKSFIRRLPPNSMRSKRLLLLILLAALAAAVLLSLLLGSQNLSLRELGTVLSAGDTQSPTYRIFLYVRVPRTLSGLLAGAALAVSGALIQAVLHNDLASPNLIGVNAGAGFFALLAATLLPASAALVPTAAFCGALGTSLLIYAIAMRTGASRITLVLAGVAVSGMLTAGINTITLLFPDAVIGANGFLAGGFSGVTLSMLTPAAWQILAGLAAAFLGSSDLNVLALGEETARSLGMRVGLMRFVWIVIASLLAGAAVSFAGLLGFVGLMAPHAARRFVGSDNRLLLPASALFGALFVLLCDTCGRVLFAPFEIPVGILLSFLGGAFFLFLLRKERTR